MDERLLDDSLDEAPSIILAYTPCCCRGDQYSREVTLEHADAFEDFARKEHRASARITPAVAHLLGKEK